jgi:folate-dependent phosphoribosylglycinamide formyltransferase PurN
MMLVDDVVSTGDILAQRHFPIEDDDRCATRYEKVPSREVERIRGVPADGTEVGGGAP